MYSDADDCDYEVIMDFVNGKKRCDCPNRCRLALAYVDYGRSGRN